jgi:5-methylcytosine-specific restriction protein B
MKRGVYREGGLDRTWRTKILPLLEEHHYGEEVDVSRVYGLPALRRAVAYAKEAATAGTDAADDGE